MNEREFARIFSLPFNEAARFFRDKLTIESSAWDELSGAAHAKAFTSAGAYHAELLAELRRMTDKAIAGGMDIREFREKFRPLVARYGWQLKGGGPAWRSDLIWRTNITTSYQAGRWQQFRQGGIDYLRYDHLDGQTNPRLNHMAMDGLILPIGDPFWTVNYPPNGWRCHCRAVAATAGEYAGLPVEQRRRPEGWRDMADGGWRYNVGQAGERKGYAALTEKFESLPNDIARAWMARFLAEPAFERFVDGKIGGRFPVAVLDEDAMELIGSVGQTVWLAEETLRRELGADDYRRVQRLIDKGEHYADGGETFFLVEDGMSYEAKIAAGDNGGRTELISLAVYPWISPTE